MEMLELENEIDSMIKDILNDEEMECIFGGNINIKDFINQIIFELYKDSIIKNSEKRSLRSFVPQGKISSDAEYQAKKRSLSYASFYKEELKNKLEGRKIDTRNIEGLEIKSMECIEERIDGHNLNKFNNFQLETMQKCEILKAIISKKIVENKKISNKRFLEIYAELDEYMLNLENVESNCDYAMNLINIYDIERHYLTELVYSIATYMEENKIGDFPDDSYIQLLTNFYYEEQNFSCENRFILKRSSYIKDFIDNTRENEKYFEANRLINIMILKFFILKNAILRESAMKIDIGKMEVYIRENYNLFHLIKNKTWNNKKIKLARKIFDVFFSESKNS